MKKTLTTIALATVLMVGTTFANTGIIIAGNSAPQPAASETSADNDGIIIAGFAGIIIAGFTGIIISGFVDTTVSSANADGIIIAG